MKKTKEVHKDPPLSKSAPVGAVFDHDVSAEGLQFATEAFLVRLAHELRNSLAPIRSAVDLLHLKSLDPPFRSAIAMIDRQTNQMGRIVDDLIDISQISDNTFRLVNAESVSVKDAVLRGVSAARPQIEASEQTLFVDIPSDQAYFVGDQVRMGQVIADLLENASEHSEHGARISVSVSYSEDKAFISVSDTGSGIEPALLEKIFHMHAKAPHVSGTRFEGLGASLTRALRVIDLHGGRIVAESAGTGKGSVFTITLPVHRNPPRPVDMLDESDGPAETRTALRVLVVDDNADAALGMGKILGRMGHDVRTVHEGAKALETIEFFRPDVVLLDIGMPGMNGFEVAQHIRVHPWGASIVLAATTGWGQDADRSESRDSGFDYHLTKPIEVSTLSELLRKVSERARVVSPLRPEALGKKPAERED